MDLDVSAGKTAEGLVGLERRRGAGERRALVVVVDLDDDIGRTVGESVIVGYDNVLEASLLFALERPEDADVNALFAGLNLFKKLSRAYGEVEIAVVGGDSRSLIEAQRKVKDRVKGIVESLKGDGGEVEIYLISDGEDELIVGQVLGSIAPIAGVKRVIVSQHLSIESNYALILRYLKKVVEEPRLSLYLLGIPGMVLAISSLLSLIGLLSIALKLAFLILGLVLMVYGFGLETSVRKLVWRLVEELSDKPHIKIAGTAVVAITSMTGGLIAYYGYTSGGLVGLLEAFLGYTTPLVLGGATIYAIIKIIVRVAEGRVDVGKQIALAAVLGFSSLAFYSLGDQLSVQLASGQSVPEALIASLLNSRFVQYLVVGAGLAGLIELISRTTTAR